MKNNLKIYESSIENVSYGLYLAVIDPFRIPNSVSLGEVHIYQVPPNTEQSEEQNSNESP